MDEVSAPVNEQTLPPNKAELLARIARARSALEATVDPLSEAQLTAPGPDGGWSVKDHLAHLTVWRQSLLALLEGRDRAAAVGLSTSDEEAGIDAVNAILYARNSALPLPEVLAAFHQSHHRVVRALEGLTDEDLFKPYSHYQPNDPPYNAQPVLGWIVGNTYEHDREHQGWIEALVRGR